jgi:hypothetical protein
MITQGGIVLFSLVLLQLQAQATTAKENVAFRGSALRPALLRCAKSDSAK